MSHKLTTPKPSCWLLRRSPIALFVPALTVAVLYKHRHMNTATFTCLQSPGKLHSSNMKCLLVLVLVVLAVAYAQVIVSPGIYGVLPAVPAVVPAQPGYVAATRGSVHVVPGNVPIASHHLNLAPAPGTL